jgi:hypothetical protein
MPPAGLPTTFGVADTTVDGVTWVLIIDLRDNQGPSITNASEAVLSRIANAFSERDGKCLPERFRFFEAYEHRIRPRARLGGLAYDREIAQVKWPGGSWCFDTAWYRGELPQPLFHLFDAWLRRGAA